MDAAWQTVNKFFGPTFGGKDWQAIGDEYRQKLATVQDDEAMSVVISPDGTLIASGSYDQQI